jgi:hypothetical protein
VSCLLAFAGCDKRFLSRLVFLVQYDGVVDRFLLSSSAAAAEQNDQSIIFFCGSM